MRRILYLTVNAGAGHVRAAQAVKQGLRQLNIRSHALTIDAFRYASRFLSRVVLGSYMEILKMAPAIYGYLYNRAEASESMGEANGLLNKASAPRFRRLLKRFRPDVVICTHAFPVGVMARLKRKGYLKAPLVTVITDFTVYPFWLHEMVDLYFVASSEQQERMVAKGIERSKIFVTGIPIDPQFTYAYDRVKILDKYGLRPDLPTLLVMGGGLGLGPVQQVVKILSDLPQPHQLMVIAGKNRRLTEELQGLAATYDIPIKIFGFVDNVHVLMDAADLIVTKPGALTSAEALAKGLPLVIVDPLPGQEERNAAFLARHEAAIVVNDLALLSEEVGNLLTAPARLAELRANARALGNPRAALDVARIIAGKYQLEAKG